MRYEIKYVLPAAQFDSVLKSVHSSPYMFREIYQERSVNNIYLDTFDLSDYNDAVNGVSSRSKTRIRWYGPLWQDVERPVLEVKRKVGLSGSKEGLPLPRMIFGEGFKWQHYARAIDDMNPALHSDQNLLKLTRLHERLPSVVNTYKRRYFAAPDGLCRITLDWDMNFYSLAAAVMHARFCSTDRNIILEIKFEESNLRDVAAYVRSLGYRMAKNSKYVNGVNAVYYGGLSL
jgi:hypothetical protein